MQDWTSLLIEKTPIRQVLAFESLGSTNDYAKELLQTGSPSQLFPLLISADRQSAGRGQGDKQWWTGEGAVAVSLILPLDVLSLTRNELPVFSLQVGQVVAETLTYFFQARGIGENQAVVTVKPPNDVLVNGEKISGILLESPTPKTLIIGIGVNLNNSLADRPVELQKTPITSFVEVSGLVLARSEFLCELFERLFRVIDGYSSEASCSNESNSCSLPHRNVIPHSVAGQAAILRSSSSAAVAAVAD